MLSDGDELDTYLLEIATYPEARVASQVMDDIALAWLGRQELPEVVVLFLYPKGNVLPAETIKLKSRQGCTTWDASWRIVKLWEVPAGDLLATGDIGVVPWVPLAQFDGPPEPIIRECRARIDKVGSHVIMAIADDARFERLDRACRDVPEPRGVSQEAYVLMCLPARRRQPAGSPFFVFLGPW